MQKQVGDFRLVQTPQIEPIAIKLIPNEYQGIVLQFSGLAERLPCLNQLVKGLYFLHGRVIPFGKLLKSSRLETL